MDLTELMDLISTGWMKYIVTVVVFVAIFIIYKFLSRLVSRTGRRLELEPHAVNAIRLVLRVATVFSSMYVIFALYEIPTTVFVSGSALVGALLGFGSSQTINNIVAGFYVLISQPFRVKDYATRLVMDFNTCRLPFREEFSGKRNLMRQMPTCMTYLVSIYTLPVVRSRK